MLLLFLYLSLLLLLQLAVGSCPILHTYFIKVFNRFNLLTQEITIKTVFVGGASWTGLWKEPINKRDELMWACGWEQTCLWNSDKLLDSLTLSLSAIPTLHRAMHWGQHEGLHRQHFVYTHSILFVYTAVHQGKKGEWWSAPALLCWYCFQTPIPVWELVLQLYVQIAIASTVLLSHA